MQPIQQNLPRGARAPIMLSIDGVPGVQRDGTNFDSDCYLSSTWTRFDKQRPRKIGGYITINETDSRICRGMAIAPVGNTTAVYLGTSNTLKRFTTDFNGTNTALVDMTPGGFVTSASNSWQFDLFASYTGVGVGVNTIIAHAAPNLGNINNTTDEPVWYLSASNAVGPFVTTGFTADGGVCVAAPYLFLYSSDGFVRWSAPGDPTSFPGANYAYIGSGTKIVKGMAVRGTTVPTVLFWTMDGLIKATYTGATADAFAFTTITSQSSILSPNSVIEDSGVYYWVGTDKFYMYNGVVQENINVQNKDYFFDNLDKVNATKVFGFKVGRYSEIWFPFPVSGGNGECSQAVIQNTLTKVWYDAALARSAGVSAQASSYPILTSNINTGTVPAPLYNTWQHEYGYDQIVSSTGVRTDIPCGFASQYFYVFDRTDNNLRATRFIQDFKTNDSTQFNVYFDTKAFPMGPTVTLGPYPFTTLSALPYIDLGALNHRLWSVRIVVTRKAATAGDPAPFYQLGKSYIDVQGSYDLPGDVRP